MIANEIAKIVIHLTLVEQSISKNIAEAKDMKGIS